MSVETLPLVDGNRQTKCPNCGSDNPGRVVECKCGYNYLTKELAPSRVVGKRFRIRMVAYVLDFVLDTIVYWAVSILLGVIIGLALALLGREFSLDDEVSQVCGFFSGIMTSLFYFVIFEWMYGATPGKAVLGLRVVQSDGEPCGLGAAIVRALFRYIDGLFFGLPAYSSMTQPLYQRIGDKRAKTVVVDSHNPVIRKRHPAWRFVVAGAIYTVAVFCSIMVETVASLR